MAGTGRRGVQPGMDDVERDALRAEGLDADDPRVVAATDFVAWELSLLADFVRASEYVAGREVLGTWLRKRRV
jgi:hypothetical protein